MKIKANKGPIRPKKKKSKQRKTKQKSTKIPLNLFFVGPTAPCLGPAWSVVDTPMTTLGESQCFLCQWVSIAASFGCGALSAPLFPPPPAPSVHFSLSVLKYHRHALCVLSQSREFICAESGCVWETLFLCSHRSPLALDIPTSSSPYLLRLEGRGLMTTSHWVLPSLSPSAPCPFVGLHVNSHLLQEEAPLMRVKWGTDL